MLNKSRLVTVALTIAAIAVLMRVDTARDLITGDDKFLGIF